MNLVRTLGGAALFCLAGAGLSGCLSAPDYSTTPHIDPNSVKVMLKNDRSGKRDSIEIAINFQDGDGDLGLSDGDTQAPYDYRNGTNRYYENYFIQPYYKNKSGVFVPLVSTISYNGRFPRLTDADARPGPIKGVLRRSIVVSLLDPAESSQPGTEYYFQISIADRALHESNVITTETVKL